jgi:hypothetical protein
MSYSPPVPETGRRARVRGCAGAGAAAAADADQLRDQIIQHTTYRTQAKKAKSGSIGNIYWILDVDIGSF